MTDWTDEQKRAITTDNSNIIVSAGAGSGKTAVLSERVLNKLRNGIHINELLILTFTNLAAQEMSMRIRDKIKEEGLLNELDLIDNSFITTFDSYALSLVKKYHYLLHIKKNINIVDTGVINLEKIRIIDEIFEDKYSRKDIKFITMINDLCTKDDKIIRDCILDLATKISIKINPEEYLNNYIDYYYNSSFINSNIKEYENIIIEKVIEIKEILNNISYIDCDYSSKMEKIIGNLITCNNYEDIRKNLNIKLPIIPKNSVDELKELKETINNLIKELNNLCEFSLEELKNQIINTKEYAEVIIDILKEYFKKLNLYKTKYDVYEFNDISSFAYQLLIENPDIKEIVKNSFKEIMIDEYQDTNDAQEEFIKLIENNNIYMVGDIKQSIYRFRNANPNIFKNKYELYKDNKYGIKIDLNKNFRSRSNVLNNINIIFNEIMDLDIGGADYKGSHQLVFGNNIYNLGAEQNYDIDILEYENESKEFNKEEIEAFIVCKDIIKKINDKYQIYDKKIKGLRNVEYNDFAILIDRTKQFELYKKIFEYHNVPLILLKDENIVEDEIVYIFNNIINLIIKIHDNIFDNSFKHSFISIARSFLFNIDDDTIFDYFSNNNFYNNEIYNICTKISIELDSLTIYQVLNKIIDLFEIYDKLSLVGDIDIKISKIEYILDLSKSLEELSYNIYTFKEYLSNLTIKNQEIKIPATNSGIGVRIMTIYKSKGLEFPICYMPELYRPFNISDLKELFTYSNEYGIVLPCFKEGIINTIRLSLLKNKYLKDEISEEIRLLYVGLTRAKEKLVLINYNNHNKNTNPLKNYDKLKYRSFKDIIDSVNYVLENYTTNINIDDLNLTKKYNKNAITNINIESDNDIIVNEIVDNSYIEEKKVFSHKSNKMVSEEDKKNIEYGKRMHYLLEIIDFKNPDFDKYNMSKLEKERITMFLNNKILDNIDECNIYKEYEFIYEDKNVVKHGIIDLLLEYKDSLIIVDYKLKNIDNDYYKEQVNGYKIFLNKKTGKNIKCFLYSILDNVIKEVK